MTSAECIRRSMYNIIMYSPSGLFRLMSVHYGKSRSPGSLRRLYNFGITRRAKAINFRVLKYIVNSSVVHILVYDTILCCGVRLIPAYYYNNMCIVHNLI